MRIAQVAPLYESVPPRLYGGTERIVAYLSDALVNLGHEVSLFASADSRTNAKLIPVCDTALRLNDAVDPLAPHIVELQMVQERIHEFDVVHYHVDYLHFPVSRFNHTPHLTTLHGRLDIPELQCVYDHFPDMPVVSISYSQRQPLPQARWFGNVYHGLPTDLYDFGKGEGDYLAFIGRISPEKRLDRAIEIAKKAGIRLKVAAKVDKADQEYFEMEIQPLLDDSLVEFMGEANEHQKKDLLRNAKALLFPIDWPEPFGLVMLEAMACGTPVVAFNHGSVPEVIDHGTTGFIVNSIDEAVDALGQIDSFDRLACRSRFEERFGAERMAMDYTTLYELICLPKLQINPVLNGTLFYKQPPKHSA